MLLIKTVVGKDLHCFYACSYKTDISAVFYVQNKMHFFYLNFNTETVNKVAFKIVQHGPQLLVFHTSLDILLHLMAMLFRCARVLVPSVVLYFKSSQIHLKK